MGELNFIETTLFGWSPLTPEFSEVQLVNHPNNPKTFRVSLPNDPRVEKTTTLSDRNSDITLE